MNNFKKLGIFFYFIATIVSCIQQREYVSYKIKKGDTMSSIAQRHQISLGELFKINPGIRKTPPENAYIIVPKIATKNAHKKEQTNDSKSEELLEEDGTYTVKKGDTFYSLSKRFGLTFDELKGLNPALKDGLKTGMSLHVSKTSPKEEEKEEVIVNYIDHKVLKGDTVYNITHRYNITSEELYDANPELSEGLKLGMTLRIPQKGIPEEEENSEEENSVLLENFSTGKIANIAVLLPYQLNKLKDSSDIESKFKSKNSLTNIATDFHQGVEIAIDSLRERGVSVKVTFIDTENSKNRIENLALNEEFSQYDMVIGPLFFNNARFLAYQIENTPVIMPFYSKKQTMDSSENLIKTIPNEEILENKLVEYLKNNYTNEKILIVTDNKLDSDRKLRKIVPELKEFCTSLNILKPEKGYIDKQRFNERIKPNEPNWVILISDEAVTISDVINNLGAYPKEKYQIRLFGLKKDANFDGLVNNNYLGKLNFTYPTSEYVDISSPKVKAFYNKFKRKNNTLPNKYSLRGFDVTYDAIARLVSYDSFIYGITQGKSERLVSVFKYNNQSNNGVILIKYDDNLAVESVE